MTHKAAWRFPASNFGLFQDFNDNQTTHFTRAPINHLVRESIQNSIDARADSGELIEVSFSEVSIPTELLDAANYRRHLRSCIDIATRRDNELAVENYQHALDALNSDEIRALRIRDTGTIGLSGRHWEALVSSQGVVHKNDPNGVPGGSFGVGKNVVFLFSSIHAVIYSTRYANRQEGTVQKAIGRAQLMSHPTNNHRDHHQPSGWLDIKREPITGRDIPEPLRLNSQGTAIFILGWNPINTNWPTEISMKVAQNFFYAIHHRALKVTVDPLNAPQITVDSRTISDLLTGDSPESHQFRSYYETIRDCELHQAAGKNSPRLFDLYIKTGEGPNRTAVINRNGMFITDATSLSYNPLNLRHKSTWPDYAIVAMPATAAADRWIRTMENPSHDSISPDQLKTQLDQGEASSIFAGIRRESRDLIDDLAGSTIPGTSINVRELADLLPEAGPEENSREYEVTVTPAKPALPKSSAADDGEDHTYVETDSTVPGVSEINPGDGDNDTSDIDTGEGGNPPNPGDDPDRDVKDTDETPARPRTVRHQRIIAEDPHSVHVFLTADKASPITVGVKPAGAEFRQEPSFTITSIETVDCPDLAIKAELPAKSFQITPDANQRIHLRLTFESNIDNLALKIA